MYTNCNQSVYIFLLVWYNERVGEIMKTLLKNCNLYTPKLIGIVDVLIDNGKIVKIKKDIKEKCEIIDCTGKMICPMFVDGHEHLTKKGVDYTARGILNSGVNTVVGVLAEEQSIEEVQKLIDKTKELKDKFNINAYCLAGSKNFIHDISKFILKNDCVVGIKTALFTTQRPKPNLSYEKLKTDAITISDLSIKTGKALQLHIHLDHPFGRGMSKPSIEEINSGSLDNLHWLDKIVEETGVSYSIFKLAHSEKYHDRILEYANKGVYLDYTATHRTDETKYDSLIKAIKSNKYDLTKFSISSDLGILTTERGFVGEETPFTLLNTIKILVNKGLSFEQVLPLVTTNALALIEKKEELICVGEKANLIMLDSDFKIEKIIMQ